MKKALKIGIMGMIGFMLFVYGGLNGYCLAWRRLYDRGNYIGADGLSCIARHTFKPVFVTYIENIAAKNYGIPFYLVNLGNAAPDVIERRKIDKRVDTLEIY